MYSSSFYFSSVRFCIRVIFLIVVIGATGLKGSTQENNLYHFSNKISEKDSTYVLQLIQQSQSFEYKNMDTALVMLDTALAISQTWNFGYGIGNVYIARAVYGLTQGNYSLADSFLHKAYPYCYLVSKFAKTNRLLALWNSIAGTLASYQGNYSKALAHDYAVIKALNEFPGDSTIVVLKINAYNGIGSMLQYLYQPQEAIFYLNQAESLALQYHQEESLAQIYVNFGGCYSQLNNPEKALLFYEKAIKLSTKYNNTYVLQIAHLAIGKMYHKQKSYDSAISYFKKAILVSDKTNPYMSKITPFLSLGQSYFSKKQYLLAAEYANKALQFSEDLKAPQNVIYAHSLLADIYQMDQQWKRAFQHQFAYSSLKDSLDKINKSEEITQQEIKFRVAEKDKKLAEQKLSINQQSSALREKNLWISGICITVFLLAAFLFAFFRNYSNKKKLELKNLEILRLKAMMDGEERERSRIATELHDGIASQLLAVKLSLSTTLQREPHRTLQSEDFQKSFEYLEEAMQDLRHTAQNLAPGNQMNISLKYAIAQFCQKMEANGPTEIIFQEYGATEPKDSMLKLSIFRIVQELVQNALKHAQAHCILVQLNCEHDFTAITVQDDGIGFDTQNSDQGQGLGNLKNRVAAFNGSIELISSLNKGTTMYMELHHPLI